jgi:hypothetical protein
VIAALVTIRIDDNKAGLKCGSCWTLVAAEADEEGNDDDGGGGADRVEL